MLAIRSSSEGRLFAFVSVGFAATLAGVAPQVSYGGLAYHVSSTSVKALSTASSPNPTIKKQQCIADPSVPIYHDASAYLVEFSGTITWDGQVSLDPTTPFSSPPEPAQSGFVPGAAPAFGPYPAQPILSTTPVDNGDGTFTVGFEGYWAPFFSSGGTNLPPTNILQDEDLIVANFDTNDNYDTSLGIPQVTYTVTYDSLGVWDTSIGELVTATNPDTSPEDENSWTAAITTTGSPDLNVPEPSAAAGMLLIGGRLLLRRRRI